MGTIEQNYTEVNHMKKVFTLNWYIYRCLPPISNEVSDSVSQKIDIKKQARCERDKT